MSPKSLPISVPIYQPLNGHAVNCNPPQSNIIELTAGNAYHFKFKSANQSCKGCTILISSTSPGGYSNHSGSPPLACNTTGSISYSVRLPFHPSFSQTYKI